MKRYYTLVISTLCSFTFAMAQNTISRDVTVEHEYKPSIAESDKVESNPVRKTITSETVVTPEFSTEEPVTDTRATEATTLSQQHMPVSEQKPGNGEIEVGIGHPQTMLRFHYGYSLSDRDHVGVHLHHHAEWGLKTDERTSVGLDYHHHGDKLNYFLNLEGSNEYFTYYGRYYNDSTRLEGVHYHNLNKYDKQNIWRLNVRTGVQSTGKDDLNYLASVEYHIYGRPGSVVEHTISENLQVNYRWDAHKAGVNFKQMNYIHHLQGYTAEAYAYHGITHNSRHCFRIEPCYEWKNQRIFVHAGINLDFNIGKGYQLSASDATTPGPEQVAFAPSPNVRFEALLHPKYVLAYVTANGTLGTSSMEAYYNQNKYKNGGSVVSSHHVSGYTPIDLKAGFRFHALQSLLADIHAGYQYSMNAGAYTMYAMPFSYEKLFGTDKDVIKRDGFASFGYTNFQRWNLGAQIDYHYRDIIELKVWGDWYYYTHCHDDKGDKMSVYDRPNWELGTKIVGHIDEHWSVYTWDNFMGKRTNKIVTKYSKGDVYTFLPPRDVTLPAYIDVNLGVGYQFAHTGKDALDRLSLAAELKNFIHRKNMIWYGYESEGINFLLSAKWSF